MLSIYLYMENKKNVQHSMEREMKLKSKANIVAQNNEQIDTDT